MSTDTSITRSEAKRARDKAYYAQNRLKVIARSHAYYQNNKPSIHKKMRAYRDAHPDKALAYQRTSYSRNAAHYREKSKRWRSSHIEQIWEKQRTPEFREIVRQWRTSNRERVNAYFREYYKTHPARREYLREWSTRSPRRKAIQTKWEVCGHLCYICGNRLERLEIVVDHVIPLAKGGSNDLNNLMPTHNRCNCRKNDRLDFPIVRPDLVGIARVD